jgi:hypothetical protein
MLQFIRLAPPLSIIAIEGEPVAEIGKLMAREVDSDVTFALGYANGEGLYIPASYMLAEGGYEVDSYWEFGYTDALKEGIEEVVANGIRFLKANITA